MEQLDKFIRGLQVIQTLLWDNAAYPINANYEAIEINCVDWNKVSLDQIHYLAELGFTPGVDDDYYATKEILGDDFGPFPFEKEGWHNISQEHWDSVREVLTGAFTWVL